MVQLPATSAIEYVAACWVPGAEGIFVGERERKRKLERKLKLSGGLMPVPPNFNAGALKMRDRKMEDHGS